MHFKPTIIGAAAPTSPVAPTALPGVARKPVDMPMAELRRRFPDVGDDILAEVRASLAASISSGADATAWLSYGEESQRRAAALIATCSSIGEDDVLGAVPRHLCRLQDLCRELAAAFRASGLLRPGNPGRTWASLRPEVEQLRQCLDAALPAMVRRQGDLARPMQEVRGLKRRIRVGILAAQVLLDSVPEAGAHLLAGRQASLLGSEALLDQLLLRLEQDGEHLAVLISLVQEAVLVQLPSLMHCLAALPAKPNETERFLATEKLARLLQFVERKT